MLSYLQCIKLILLSVIGRGNKYSVFMDRNRFRDAKHYSLHINLYNCIRFFSFSSNARSLQQNDSIFTGKCIKFVFTFVLFEEGATIDSS